MRKTPSKSTCFLIFFLPFLLVFLASEATAVENDPSGAQQEMVVIEIDPEAAPPLRHEETPQFSWGSKINLDFRLRNNRDLDSQDGDRDTTTNASLTLAGLYLSRPRVFLPSFEFFGEVRLKRGVVRKEDRGKTQDETDIDFRKGFLIWRRFYSPSFRLQVGRQRFKDFREWVYDDNLDAIRLFYEEDRLELQLSYSTNVFDPEDENDEIKNIILYGIYDVWKKDKAAAYIVDRRGRFEEGEPGFHLRSLGISWKGKSIKKQRYWLEAAVVTGNENKKDVFGYGFDFGWTSRFKLPYKPALSIGYAYGSGDSNLDDNNDKNFRQTGLHDNSAKLRGLTRVEQYGELFEPELSNLMVSTLGIGIRPIKRASLDLVYHHFQQVWAFQARENELRDVGIKEDPNGESRNLGDEIDLIFGWKMTKDLRLQAISAYFMPGAAFSDADNAFLGKIRLRILL